jgi:DNA processing protein
MNTETVTDEERIARAELTWLAKPGDRRLGGLVRMTGAARTMTLIRAGRIPGEAGPASAGNAQQAVNRWRSALEKVPPRGEVERALGGRFRLVCPGDAEWPAGLDGLGDAAPIALWVTGVANLRFSCLRSVAVVGARAATAYGSYVAADLAASVAARGWTVVSGGAFGIDAAAHRGALGADGVTVAVLAGGLDVPYPAAHAGLLDEIARQGAIVSEQPPGRNVSRLRFLARNRVLAALATGTLVVEAGERSGSMNTARHARDLGRPLMAVPGPVTSDPSAGCHHIIRNWQGSLVTSGGDVLDTLTAAGTAPAG